MRRRAFENRSQIIAYGAHAISLGVLELAGEATFSAEEADVVEIDKFSFGARLL